MGTYGRSIGAVRTRANNGGEYVDMLVKYVAMVALLSLLGLSIASCAIRSGGNGDYYAPGTSYQYNRLNPDDFGGHDHGEGGHAAHH